MTPFDGLNEDDTAILNRAAAELDAKGFSQENKNLRLWILRAAITGNVDNIGNVRDPAYWKQRNGDGSFVANTPDVLAALENLLTGDGNKVFCNKLAALMIIQGVIKYFQASGDTEMVAKIQALLSPKYEDWNTDGGVIADAAFMGLQNGKALLMQNDGTIRQVSLDDFSADDRNQLTGGVRTWTSASGTRTVEGEFIGTNDAGKILIEKPDGGRYAIALQNFSDTDQEFLDEHGGGLKLNEELPQGGIDLFWQHVPEEGTKEFKVEDLSPGDQVWFQNPYYRAPEAGNAEEEAAFSGEEGSNIFYTGDGVFVYIYGDAGQHLELTEQEKQASMLAWATVRVADGEQRASNDTVAAQNSMNAGNAAPSWSPPPPVEAPQDPDEDEEQEYLDELVDTAANYNRAVAAYNQEVEAYNRARPADAIALQLLKRIPAPEDFKVMIVRQPMAPAQIGAAVDNPPE